ncbi:acyltransferase [Microlunatus parietis]
MRVIVFTFVISAHVVTYTLDQEELPVAAWGLTVHFARYAFVFVSALVLCHGYQDRNLSACRFWRRRLAAVVPPYVLWTLIYYGIDTAQYGWPGLVPWLQLLLLHLVWGTEWYHLYFLLVAIQLYLVLPALRWMTDQWPAAHGLMIGIAAVIQLGYMTLINLVPAPAGPWVIIWEHAEKSLPLYALFAVGGAVAARHLDQLETGLLRHWRLLVPIGVLSLLGTLVAFNLRAAGTATWSAAAASFPSVLPWAVAATLICLLASTAWTRHHATPRGINHIVRAGARRAFGVFLIHPLLLWIIVITPSPLDQLPGTLSRVLIIFILTITGSLAVVELLLHTSLSKPLLGRSRTTRPSQTELQPG